MHYRHVKDIGFIWDKATKHNLDEVKQHVGKMSLEGPPRIYLAFIDSGITPIQYPHDVNIVKPIKKECMLGYQKVLLGIRGGNEKRHKLPREEVVDIVLSVKKKVDMESLEIRCVKNSFDVCGVNPFSKELGNFEYHLAILSENQICKDLLDNNNNNDIE